MMMEARDSLGKLRPNEKVANNTYRIMAIRSRVANVVKKDLFAICAVVGLVTFCNRANGQSDHPYRLVINTSPTLPDGFNAHVEFGPGLETERQAITAQARGKPRGES